MGKAKQCFVYNTKIIETPTTKEVYFYETPIYSHSNSDSKTSNTQAHKRKVFDEMSAHKQYDSLKRKQKHYEQTRWEIARIVDCNFDNKTKFLTLTFRENIQDITITNKEFKYFIQRLNYYLYQTKVQTLKYIATWEKQKRGAIHYHVIFFDFPFVAKEKLQDLWTYGFIKINRIDVDSMENRGRYLSKYFGKDLELKEHKKKAFFKSQNLKMPIEQKLMLTDDILQDLTQENVVFQKEYGYYRENPLYMPPYAIELAMYTGMRVSELSTLKWSDINDICISINKSAKHNRLKNEFSVGKTKTKKSRAYPVDGQINHLLARIKRVQEEHGILCEWIFTDGNGSYTHARNITDCMTRLCRENKLNGGGITKLRKTTSSDLQAKGTPKSVVASMLGHTTEVNEKYYTYDTSNLAEKKKIIQERNAKFKNLAHTG